LSFAINKVFKWKCKLVTRKRILMHETIWLWLVPKVNLSVYLMPSNFDCVSAHFSFGIVYIELQAYKYHGDLKHHQKFDHLPKALSKISTKNKLTRNLPHKCKHCNQEFLEKQRLNEHQRIHKERNFICSNCSEVIHTYLPSGFI